MFTICFYYFRRPGIDGDDLMAVSGWYKQQHQQQLLLLHQIQLFYSNCDIMNLLDQHRKINTRYEVVTMMMIMMMNNNETQKFFQSCSSLQYFHSRILIRLEGSENKQTKKVWLLQVVEVLLPLESLLIKKRFYRTLRRIQEIESIWPFFPGFFRLKQSDKQNI